MRITIGVIYYNQPQMLQYHLQEWLKYKDLAEFIVIDDHSEFPIILDDVYSFVNIYRIQDNINWNQTGARNLLYYVSNSQWVFSSDIDHVLNFENFNKLIDKLKLTTDNKNIFFLNRFFVCGNKKGKMHSSFILDKYVYLSMGGQDEDFAGSYGGVDQSFLQKSLNYLNYNWLDDVKVANYSFCDSIVDANVGVLSRDTSRNMLLFKHKKKLNFPITKMLRFRWERFFR